MRWRGLASPRSLVIRIVRGRGESRDFGRTKPIAPRGRTAQIAIGMGLRFKGPLQPLRAERTQWRGGTGIFTLWRGSATSRGDRHSCLSVAEFGRTGMSAPRVYNLSDCATGIPAPTPNGEPREFRQTNPIARRRPNGQSRDFGQTNPISKMGAPGSRLTRVRKPRPARPVSGRTRGAPNGGRTVHRAILAKRTQFPTNGAATAGRRRGSKSRGRLAARWGLGGDLPAMSAHLKMSPGKRVRIARSTGLAGAGSI